MRGFALVFLSIAAVSGVWAQGAPGTWSMVPNSPQAGNRFDDGVFVSPTTGFVIYSRTEQNGIYATEDGGQTWEARGTLPVGPRSVGFASASVGWVGTLFGPSGQQLFETRDGGRTFTNVSDRIQGASVLGICGLSVVSPTVVYGAGWCCGNGAGIIKTTNGGQTWQATRLDQLAAFLIDVHFFDASRGLATGSSLDGRAIILGTQNGGATWTVRHVSADQQEWGWKFTFPSRDVGYVAVEHLRFESPDGKVLRTTDGGLTWTDVVIPGGGRLQSVGFPVPEVGWTSGRGVRSQTLDGGQTWTRYDGPLDGAVNRFRFLSDSLGFAFGRYIYRYERGGGTSVQAPPPVSPLVTVYPNPASSRVTFVFDLQQPGHVRLEIYDLQGRRVSVVADQPFGATTHALTWDGAGGTLDLLPTATYYYRLSTSEGRDSGPFIWVRR